MIDITIDSQGIATLAWNVTNRPMNVMNQQSITAFAHTIEQVVANQAVRGIIITSNRPEFIVGADLDLVTQVRTPQEAMALTGPISTMLRRLETSGKPCVAAINGSALGGGYEVALACHYRIAADNPKTIIGLPEVGLGLLPAAGGTQRLPRMIGIAKALPYLLEGRKVSVQQALKDGLVDEVVPPGDLLERARDWLLEKGETAATQPWDQRSFRFPGGTPQSAGITQLFFGFSASLLNKTQNLYPAPEAIAACIYDGCQVDIDTGLKIEQRHFASLAGSVSTRNLIRTLFYSMGKANGLEGRSQGAPKAHFKKIGILGAGMMGAALAYVSAKVQLQVVLLDVAKEQAERGKAFSEKLLQKDVDKGRLSEAAKAEFLARILVSDDYSDLSDVDLVIEAVFENREVKAQVIRKAEEAMPGTAIFASNTSTLTISSLAKASARPAQFVGLHFFSPVEKMPLVEIIRGEQTSETTVAHALDFVQKIRKTPIVVNDCPAFYCNRAFAMFPYEAMIMLKEGVKPSIIENAAKFAGMPMPALALVDEVSVELLHKALTQARLDQGSSYQHQPQDEVMDAMVDIWKRPGRKAGKGFYEYGQDEGKVIWPGFAQHYPLAAEQPSLDEVQKRLMYSQAVEAARCVAEGVVSARDADVGSILGWGFPAAYGGVISFIDTVGARQFLQECDRLTQDYGPRFTPPDALRQQAEQGKTYF